MHIVVCVKRAPEAWRDSCCTCRRVVARQHAGNVLSCVLTEEDLYADVVFVMAALSDGGHHIAQVRQQNRIGSFDSQAIHTIHADSKYLYKVENIHTINPFLRPSQTPPSGVNQWLELIVKLSAG